VSASPCGFRWKVRSLSTTVDIRQRSPMSTTHSAREAARDQAAPRTAPQPAPLGTVDRKAPRPRINPAWPILALVFLAAAVLGIRTVLFYRSHAETDDAQLSGDISPILPRVAGYVTEVPVSENQPVHRGDLLVSLDRRDLEARALQAIAAVKNAEAEL